MHRFPFMADQQKEPRPREEPPTEGATEWPHDPPLPPREIDPSGEGDRLRTRAHPGDDTVFGANEREKPSRKSDERPARRTETENDAERSRTER